MSQFFVASPSTPENQVQFALDSGRDLVLTPGTYNLNAPLVVSRPGTVVLGLGFPVLVPEHGNASMLVLPESGVKLSGMIFDAGPVNSPVLLSVGSSVPRLGSGRGQAGDGLPGPLAGTHAEGGPGGARRGRPGSHPGHLLPCRGGRDDPRVRHDQLARQRRQLDNRRRLGLAR